MNQSLTQMHCPSCGTVATADQQFCRICGMNLDNVGKLVAQHSATPIERHTKLEKRQAEQALVRDMATWVMRGMLVMGIAVMMLVLNKFFPLGGAFVLLSTLVLLTGLGITVYAVLNPMRKGMSSSGVSTRRQMPEQQEPQQLPTRQFVHELASITERTTQLIQPMSAPTTPTTAELDENDH